MADDLTGAADCGMACASSGLSTIVILGNTTNTVDADVLSVDADTRGLDPKQAVGETALLMRRYMSRPEQIVFKKLDSTLRGNVGAELAAVLKTQRSLASQQGHIVAVLAPAFPANGRTTLRGRQLLHGKPLEEMEIWQREGKHDSSHIPEILKDAGMRSALVPLETIRSKNGSLHKEMLKFAEGVDVLVCDAETDQDLLAISQATVALGPGTVWAGSAGLAYHLPKAVALSGKVPASANQTFALGPTLFVIGSASTISREQAKVLSASPEVATIAIPPPDLLTGTQSTSMREHKRFLSEALNSGRDVLVTLDTENKFKPSDGRLLSSALAQLVSPVADRIGAFVTGGGETARCVLQAWGVMGLRLIKELEPGLPFSITENWSRRLPVITKAGDFGNPRTLLHCQEFLRSLERVSHQASIGETSNRPIIAITMGDAAGVGPEVIMKSLSHAELYERCRPLVIGDAERLREAARIVGLKLEVRSLLSEELGEAAYKTGTVDCIDLKLIPKNLPWGKISPAAGDAAFRYIDVAAKLASSGKVGAICTAPLNKEALHAGGHKYPGHTEMLAALTETPEVSMMLLTPKLRVIHVTTHIGLLDAIAKIEPGLVERTIARGHDALEKSGIPNPRIGVCAINPHAGENGLFGHGEEEQKIEPAIEACRKKEWNIEGPLPADTLFYRAQRGDFDLVVAMYHDQGHGPVKVLGLEAGVNITVGLPVIRTSVDHGTAFDISGTGKADERSMLEALRQAIQLANRNPNLTTSK
jgi:4-hydroxythreonine-4-phosphate dehydrogenase